MHEEAPILKAKMRDRTGTRYAKRVRDAGGLPAVVYGHGEPPSPVVVEAREAVRLIHHGDRIFRIQLDGGDPETVYLKEVQFDYLGSEIVHCDFTRVDLDERMTVRVSLAWSGDAPGLKEPGAIMMHPNDEIELECTLSNLPDEIEVDLSSLEVGDTITAGDVKLPLDTMELVSDPDMVVATIVVKAEEPEEEVGEAVEVGEAAQPEVISERKEEEAGGEEES